MRRIGALCLVVAACTSSSDGFVTPPVGGAVATVVVHMPANSLAVGDFFTATATATDDNGITITGQTFAYTSSNPAVATVVSGTGVVTGVATGAVTITASTAGKSGSVLLAVVSH